MFLWLYTHINYYYYYLVLDSVLVLSWIPRCFSLSDWHWVLHSACWILLQVFLGSKQLWDVTVCFARGVSFSFEVITSNDTRQKRELFFTPTLQTREVRLHRIHSKAGNWIQISWIPREYLVCTINLLILRAEQAVMGHWWTSHQRLPSSLFLKVHTGAMRLSLNCESPGNTPEAQTAQWFQSLDLSITSQWAFQCSPQVAGSHPPATDLILFIHSEKCSLFNILPTTWLEATWSYCLRFFSSLLVIPTIGKLPFLV